MDIDEPHAYAVAAWHRFDEQITDELLRAVAGVFAVVACADGDLAQAEVDRFVETVISSEALPRVDPKQLELIFRDLCQSMFTDVEDGRARALQAIVKIKDDPKKAELVVFAGEVAIMADARLQKAEQVALKSICDALGVSSKAP